MKIQPKIALISVLYALSLAACGQTDGDDPASEPSRFNLVSAQGDHCILDTETGLLWAGKTDTAGLHDFRHTYSWYDPDAPAGELDYRGTADAGVCSDSDCDTRNYVLAVNEAGYCGHADWRLPTRDELESINDPLRASTPPTIDTDVFPHTQAAEYWSDTAYAHQWDAAWAWNFQFGHDRADWKKSPKHVRLVRSAND